MPTATVLPFPADITLVPIRAFHIDTGLGPAVAVLFRVHVKGVQRPRGAGDQDRRYQQADEAVGEAQS